MKAGIDYIRRNAVDRTGGGMFTMLDLSYNSWGPRREFRNPQELGYGLLGLAMYYYLTRDDQVLPDILGIKKYIALSYFNRTLGTMQWMLENNGIAAIWSVRSPKLSCTSTKARSSIPFSSAMRRNCCGTPLWSSCLRC